MLHLALVDSHPALYPDPLAKSLIFVLLFAGIPNFSWGYPWLCIQESLLQSLAEHMICSELNPDRLQARQMPYLL